MAKKDDLLKYWQEVAAKAGLAPERVQAVADLLGDEAVGKVVADSLVPVPDHHRAIDTVKSEWQGKATEWQNKATGFEKWYNETALPAYNQNLKGIELLKKYQSTYGELVDDATGNRNGNGAAQNGGLTREELEKMLATRDQTYTTALKQISRITARHLKEWDEPLDPDALEKFAVENGYTSIDQAYNAWVQPRVAERQEKQWQDKIAKAVEEARRDERSKLPASSSAAQNDEPHPFFDRKPSAAKPEASATEREELSRQAFMQIWNEAGANPQS